MTEATTALLRLQTFLSPAFPTGGFAYSHGLETMVVQNEIADVDGFEDWLTGILIHGAGWNDAILLREAMRLAAAGDHNGLLDLNALALAMQPSAERHLETVAQGSAFVQAASAWMKDHENPLAGLEKTAALPVAVGSICATLAISPLSSLAAFLNAFISNLVWIGVRIIPLGQSDGLRLIARLEPQIEHLVTKANEASLDDLGGLAIAADIASQNHQTLTTRIFRS